MLATIGNYTLIAASVLCLYSMLGSLVGAKTRRVDFIESAERAVLGVAFLIILAAGLLLHALITSNFGIEYVAQYTSTTLPIQYKITALWGGQAGSMLFWLLIDRFSAVDFEV